MLPDFLVFVAMEPRSRSHPHPRAEYVFDIPAPVFSDDILNPRLPDKSRLNAQIQILLCENIVKTIYFRIEITNLLIYTKIGRNFGLF